MVQAVCDEPEDENEVGRSDTSDDELIQERDHDTELEQELSVEIEKESEITEKYFLGKGEYATIDEMLIPFRGRCNFIQYIPNKPANYGLKVFVLCNSKTFYVSNLEVYCCQQPEGPYKKSNTPDNITHRLMQPWKGKNRNLTCDSWYTSYPLAVNLLKDKTTIVETMRQNKRELPSEFLPSKNQRRRLV
ncbi:DDE_Tnp_1_7 domain-containing protein [Trichonephila clavata]|uniref:DDE_Tnp_1_7 domain-containing protein n=1 Tax=Trichonephila clavata TaxID=2740835 RepID=A0A8X6M453_TRICU|nr:DDE_Tnp_1_7 domain-containing protein [Trichonephila clavata]